MLHARAHALGPAIRPSLVENSYSMVRIRTYAGGKKQKEENEDEIKNRGVVVVGRKIVRY